MKSLFDINLRYTNEALELDRKINGVLEPIFEEYIKRGYSPREVSHLIIHSSISLECETILEIDYKRAKEKIRKEKNEKKL